MKIRLVGIHDRGAKTKHWRKFPGRSIENVTELHFANSDGSAFSVSGHRVAEVAAKQSDRWAPDWTREVVVCKDESGRYVLRICCRGSEQREVFSESDFADDRQQLEDLLVLHEPEQIDLTTNAAVTKRNLMDDLSRSWYRQITDVSEAVTAREAPVEG